MTRTTARPFFRYRQPRAIDIDQPLTMHRRQHGHLLAEIGVRCDGVEIDGEVTHQALDDSIPMPVLIVELASSGRGKEACLDGADVSGNIRNILDESVREG